MLKIMKKYIYKSSLEYYYLYAVFSGVLAMGYF